MTKSETILNLTEKGATASEISEAIGCKLSTARQNIRRLRKLGHVIEVRNGTYRLIYRAPKPPESTIKQVRTILDSGDEWGVCEMSNMIGKHRRSILNAIWDLRRSGMKIDRVWNGGWFYVKVQDE